MRIITKKISLEPYKSRLNGSLKAYDGEEEPVSFDSYNKYDIRFNNYGMLPLDVKYGDKVLSYPTLIERYYFCKKYIEMLGYDTKCGNGEYKDAIDYYNHTSKYQVNSTKETYEDLHNTYEEYGGNAFFEWCNEILFGGKDVVYSTVDIDGINNSAHIDIPILFTNTIDDMGEFSIFCEEWEEGAEYTEGDIAMYDDKVWMKNAIGDGSIYSKKYKELYFPQISGMPHDENYQWYEKSKNEISGETNQWDDYTDYYFSKNDTIYSEKLSATSYTRIDGKVYYDVNPKDVAYRYEIYTNGDLGFYVIKDVIYKPYVTEYIEYDGTYVFVYDIDNFVQLNMKYCYIKGQKIYSKVKEDGKSYYFKIDDNEYDVKNSETFVSYNGNAYIVSGDTINVGGVIHPKITSYTSIDGKVYYISSNNKIVVLSRTNDKYTLSDSLITDLGDDLTGKDITNKSSGYTIEDGYVYVFKPYNEYKLDELSGYTESKLSSFETYNQAFDDMGNRLPGCLQIEGDKYKEPTENSQLDIPYRVGNVNDLTLIKDDEDGKEWFGNILTSITFYYVDYYGNIIEGSEKKCGYGDSLLTTINDLVSQLNDFKKDLDVKKHYSIDEVLRCKLQYHMGAIITQDNEKYKLKDENSEYGIRYEEEVKLIEKTFEYMFSEFSSFILRYYEFEYNETFDKLNEYSDEYIKVGKSYYSFKIDDLISENQNGYRGKHDGMIAAPVFREEYKLGSSSLENIDANIYIDRGFSSSFEKHLKMFDVKSMEALENMGNGFYNIIEN